MAFYLIIIILKILVKVFEISSLSKNKINVIKKNARKIQQENNNLSSEMKKVYRIYNLIYKKNNQL